MSVHHEKIVLHSTVLFSKFTVYKVAYSRLYLVQISGLWGHIGTIKHTLLFQLQRCSMLDTQLKKLVHMATVTQLLLHS